LKERETERQKDRKTERQKDRETESQRDREPERQKKNSLKRITPEVLTTNLIYPVSFMERNGKRVIM
jgi:hypothetical protein